eukprot:TRINITY_DN15290_c0_g1_i1.p1 TRINITY_DN15290_c0_g1~~TRINITY_DN15290_c0_g1_i1.p1  ORF type:complete len:582 (+),score=220.60 TRINITY_DN15290_c0_g1_i1:56-1801(+)
MAAVPVLMNKSRRSRSLASSAGSPRTPAGLFSSGGLSEEDISPHINQSGSMAGSAFDDVDPRNDLPPPPARRASRESGLSSLSRSSPAPAAEQVVNPSPSVTPSAAVMVPKLPIGPAGVAPANSEHAPAPAVKPDTTPVVQDEAAAPTEQAATPAEPALLSFVKKSPSPAPVEDTSMDMLSMSSSLASVGRTKLREKRRASETPKKVVEGLTEEEVQELREAGRMNEVLRKEVVTLSSRKETLEKDLEKSYQSEVKKIYDYECTLKAKDDEIGRLKAALERSQKGQKESDMAKQIAVERRKEQEDYYRAQVDVKKSQAKELARAQRDLALLMEKHEEHVKKHEDTMETVRTTYHNLSQYDTLYDEVSKLLFELRSFNGVLPEFYDMDDVREIIGKMHSYKKNYEEHHPRIPVEKLKEAALAGQAEARKLKIASQVAYPPEVNVTYDRFALCPPSPSTSLGELSSPQSLFSPSNRQTQAAMTPTRRRSRSAASSGPPTLENFSRSATTATYDYAPYSPKNAPTRRYSLAKHKSFNRSSTHTKAKERVVDQLETCLTNYSPAIGGVTPRGEPKRVAAPCPRIS